MPVDGGRQLLEKGFELLCPQVDLKEGFLEKKMRNLLGFHILIYAVVGLAVSLRSEVDVPGSPDSCRNLVVWLGSKLGGRFCFRRGSS